jgi:hypothetical protein
MEPQTDYQRGLQEGARDALIEEHTKRLNRINGSVERHAIAVEKLSGEIRELREEARRREEAVKVAASTLAEETERRRAALAEDSGRWSLLANKSTFFTGGLAVFFAAATLYLSFH